MIFKVYLYNFYYLLFWFQVYYVYKIYDFFLVFIDLFLL